MSHIRNSRNYRVSKSDITRYEAKCIVDECPWRIRVIKSKRSGSFEITKLPAEHNCLLRILQRDHKKPSSRLIANAIKQQVTDSPYLKVHKYFVISIDGTFLKGRYNGKLLIAMGFDSNNHQYPLAYGLVNKEMTINWSWFLYHLRRYVCQNRRGVCIISDRHAGIIEAMKIEQNGFTGVMGIHRFCLLHVRSNFSSHFSASHLKMLCWLAGNTSQLRKFEAALNKIKELNPDAEKWLRNIPLEMWTMSYDGGYRYGQATTNMIKSFNGILRSAHFLPVTSMIEYIYYRSVKLVAERRTQTLDDL